jgi:hypothetical protein
VAKNPIIRVLDFLAKMGITVRDDPPKVIDIAARTWGEPQGGFVLSIEQISPDEPDTPPSLSVVLRNVSSDTQTLTIPGWLHFYHFDMTAPLSPFGRELLKPERGAEIRVVLKPGEPVDTQVPIGSIFSMKAKGEYRTRVSCTVPGGSTLLSNTAVIKV